MSRVARIIIVPFLTSALTPGLFGAKWNLNFMISEKGLSEKILHLALLASTTYFLGILRFSCVYPLLVDEESEPARNLAELIHKQ